MQPIQQLRHTTVTAGSPPSRFRFYHKLRCSISSLSHSCSAGMDPEPGQYPVPDLDGVQRCISQRTSSVGGVFLVVHTAHFEPGMNVQGIRNIILTLGRQGISSAMQHFMNDPVTGGIIFEARFPEVEDDIVDPRGFPEAAALACKVMGQGWDALNLLPRVWDVRCLWDLVADDSLYIAMRASLEEIGVRVARIAGDRRDGSIPSEFGQPQEMSNVFVRFKLLYPEFRLLQSHAGLSAPASP